MRPSLPVLSLLLAACVRAGFEPAVDASRPTLADAPPAPDDRAPPGDARTERARDGARLERAAVPDKQPLDRSSVVDAAALPQGWVPIGALTGQMGSPSTEPCRTTNEDLHTVTLTHAFDLQATEVTQTQYQQVMGYVPSSNCATCPVTSASWSEAAAYCNALSQLAGLKPCYACTGSGASVSCSEEAAVAGQQIYSCAGYRLPTEAEWELAYRAGSTTALYSGAISSSYCADCAGPYPVAENIAWYCVNAKAPQPVGKKLANALGLYDMAGNVWEWCHDRYQTNLGTASVKDPWGSASNVDRVIRGGGYMNYVEVLRGAFRGYVKPTFKLVDLGFRCARTR
jgi:formylglycine-generating enzyme required for sulfatase activity